MSDHHLLACSVCEKPLLNVVVTPAEGVEFLLKAFCPYCGDCSFATSVKGRFYLVGISEKISEDEVRFLTLPVSPMEIDGNNVAVNVQKVEV